MSLLDVNNLLRCLNCQNHMFVLSTGSSLTGMHGHMGVTPISLLLLSSPFVCGIYWELLCPRNKLASFKCSKDSTVGELEKYGYSKIYPIYGTIIIVTVKETNFIFRDHF